MLNNLSNPPPEPFKLIKTVHKKPVILVTLAVAWILLSVTLYYWGHKPFDMAAFAALGRAAIDILIAAAGFSLAGAMGRTLLGSARRDKPAGQKLAAPAWERYEQAALQAAAGLGILSLFWLLMGAAGLYTHAAAWGVLVVGLISLRKLVVSWWKDLFSVSGVWKEGRTFERFLISLLLMLIAIQVVWALAPAIKYDALSYHLQLPRQYLAAHRFVFIPDNPYWGHPQVGEMLFTWMMLLHRAESASLFGAGWGVLTLLGVMGTVNRLLIRHDSGQAFSQPGGTPPGKDRVTVGPNAGSAATAGLVAAAALMCGVTFRSLFGWSYVDLLSALMGWAVLAALMAVFEQGGSKWAVWTGIFCGLAISIKWTGGIAAPVAFLFLLLYRKWIRLPWRSLLLAAFMTGAVVAPWLLKNLLYTGSPVYPYFLATPWINAQRLQAASMVDDPLSLSQALLFPLSSTVFGWDSSAGFSSDLGPLLATLAIPGLWLLRRQASGKLILAGLGLCWAVILVGSLYFNHLQQTRLYFVLLPWAAAAAGMGWVALSSVQVPVLRVGRLLSIVILMVLVFALLQDVVRIVQIDPLKTVMGLESQSDYLERALGWYGPVTDALQDLPDGAQVLMLWESRGLYAPLNSAPDAWIDRWRADYWQLESAASIRDAWLAQGYTHLLFYRSGAQTAHEQGSPLEPQGWLELDRLLGMLPQPMSFDGVYELYTLAD